MATFENYISSFMFRHHIDPIGDAIAGRGMIAKYYRCGTIKLKSSTCRIHRNAAGNIVNKTRIIKMLLTKWPQFRAYALRLYVAGNIDLTDMIGVSFAVVAELPPILIEIEKPTHQEVMTAIAKFDLLSANDIKWLIKSFADGYFRLNEINTARCKVLEQLVDVIVIFKYAFRFLHTRADYYFKNTTEAA